MLGSIRREPIRIKRCRLVIDPATGRRISDDLVGAEITSDDVQSVVPAEQPFTQGEKRI